MLFDEISYYYYCLHIHEIMHLHWLYIHITLTLSHAEMIVSTYYSRAQIYTAHTLEFFCHTGVAKKKDLFGVRHIKTNAKVAGCPVV